MGFVRIKPATFRDVRDIYYLLKEHPDAVLPRSPSDIIQNIDRFFVYKISRRNVGVISYRFLPVIGMERVQCIEVTSLSITRKYQRRCIGTELVRYLLEYLKKFRHARIITLTFSPEFFGKMGFVCIPKKKIINKLYLGCLYCVKFPSPLDCPEIAMEYKPRAART